MNRRTLLGSDAIVVAEGASFHLRCAPPLAFALIFRARSMFHKGNGRCEAMTDRALPSSQYRDALLYYMVIKLHERRTRLFDLVSWHADITASVKTDDICWFQSVSVTKASTRVSSDSIKLPVSPFIYGFFK